MVEFNAFHLARAVTHWVGFESACDRENLLSEGSLLVPVGQFLKATTTGHVEMEHPYPEMPRRLMDVAVFPTRQSQEIDHAIEMKFIRLSGRDYTSELFDDIVRLETIDGLHNGDQVGRWLLIAGVWSDIRAKVFERRDLPFANVLPRTVLAGDDANRLTVNIVGSEGPVRQFWAKSQADLSRPNLPSEVRIDLRTQYPKEPTEQSYACLIWRILRQSPRFDCNLITPAP